MSKDDNIKGNFHTLIAAFEFKLDSYNAQYLDFCTRNKLAPSEGLIVDLRNLKETVVTLRVKYEKFSTRGT
jgi:hypothetical protein